VPRRELGAGSGDFVRPARQASKASATEASCKHGPSRAHLRVDLDLRGRGDAALRVNLAAARWEAVDRWLKADEARRGWNHG
jgi:hypothetical protein